MQELPKPHNNEEKLLKFHFIEVCMENKNFTLNSMNQLRFIYD